MCVSASLRWYGHFSIWAAAFFVLSLGIQLDEEPDRWRLIARLAAMLVVEAVGDYCILAMESSRGVNCETVRLIFGKRGVAVEVLLCLMLFSIYASVLGGMMDVIGLPSPDSD